MLMIKLAKVGKTNKKVFRIVISEQARDPYGKALEILGSYNQYEKNLQVKGDRVKYWLSKGAQMTNSINNLFLDHKIIEGEKVKNSKPGTPNKIKQAKAEKEKEKEVAKAQEAEAAKEKAKEEEAK
jgi:small subunit ribosomal protein S16